MTGISLSASDNVNNVSRDASPRISTSTILTQVATFQARNVFRSRWLIAYALFFLLAAESLLRFSGSSAGTVLSLANIVLYVVPLVTTVVGTVYFYNAREFVELLLAQPVKRSGLFFGLYAGLAIPLALSIGVGAGVPFLVRGFASSRDMIVLAALLVVGVALTLVFTGVSIAIALWCDDRLRGLSAGIALWLLAAVVYDGLVLTLVSNYSDYPLERPILALTLLNPIDLARVAMMLQLDVAALMGYTGAVFQQFLGGATGTIAALVSLLLWVLAPLAAGLRLFLRKDF